MWTRRSVRPSCRGTNSTLSSQREQVEAPPAPGPPWHFLQMTLYRRSSRPPRSRGSLHSRISEVSFTLEITPRGGDGTAVEKEEGEGSEQGALGPPFCPESLHIPTCFLPPCLCLCFNKQSSFPILLYWADSYLVFKAQSEMSPPLGSLHSSSPCLLHSHNTIPGHPSSPALSTLYGHYLFSYLFLPPGCVLGSDCI